MKKYDTLIFDLDGTLSISKQPLSKEIAELLGKATNQINIVVITGGMFEQIKKQVINQMSDDSDLNNLYILPTSGSSMRKYNPLRDSWDEVYSHKLNDEQKERVISSIKEALEKASFSIDNSELAGPQIEDRESQVTFSALGQKQLPDIKATWDPERTKRKELLSLLEHLEDEFDVKLGGSTSIDVTLKGIDKAFGINEFYAHTNLDIKNGLFVGDQIIPGGNDFPATKTGIDTLDTTGPEKTINIINSVLGNIN